MKGKTNAQKKRVAELVLSNPRAQVLYDNGKAKTVLYPEHKGTTADTWAKTKAMAKKLNGNSYSVCFLPEKRGATSADALIVDGKRCSIADFKYCESTKWNTLQKEITHAFEQAELCVIQLRKADLGVFRNAIDYIARNSGNVSVNDFIVLNEYGKCKPISKNDVLSGKYMLLLKGFL